MESRTWIAWFKANRLTQTAERAIVFAALCRDFPGALGVDGVWGWCRSPHAIHVLRAALTALPRDSAALATWSTPPAWASLS